MTLPSQDWKVPKNSPSSHENLIFCIRNILIAQIEADTNMRAKAEKSAKDFKFTKSFPHVQIICMQMKHQKLQSIYEAPQRYLTVWSWLLSRECRSERSMLVVSLKQSWVFAIKCAKLYLFTPFHSHISQSPTPWELLQRHCPLTTAAKGSTHSSVTLFFYSLYCKTLAMVSLSTLCSPSWSLSFVELMEAG